MKNMTLILAACLYGIVGCGELLEQEKKEKLEKDKKSIVSHAAFYEEPSLVGIIHGYYTFRANGEFEFKFLQIVPGVELPTKISFARGTYKMEIDDKMTLSFEADVSGCEDSDRSVSGKYTLTDDRFSFESEDKKMSISGKPTSEIKGGTVSFGGNICDYKG